MIEITNLTKQFKKPVRGKGVWGMLKTLFSRKYEIKTAVDNVNMKINDGEIVGYIGSNGAGKSTTIKMMCGILNPTSGKVFIDGDEPYKKRMKVAQKIGVVFGQKTQLWWNISLVESFKVLKEIYRVSDKDYQERMKFFDDLLGLNEFLNQPVRTLSLGQRMRADLAASLLHNPKILFLDEPTIGLDVLVKEKIRDAIKMMNQQFGTTVILTTHDMKDIEDLCSRIIMIDEGKIIYDGSIENIKYKFGDMRTLTVTPKNQVQIEQLNNFNGKMSYNKVEQNLEMKFNAQEISVEDAVNFAFKELGAKDLKIDEINIEDVVKEILESGEV